MGGSLTYPMDAAFLIALLAGILAVAAMAWMAARMKAREKEVASLEAQLRASRSQAPQEQDATAATWEWDTRRDELRMSAGWSRMIGEQEDETAGETVQPLAAMAARVHPEDAPAVNAALSNVLKGVTADYMAEHRVRCKNGEYIWIVSRGSVVERDAAGKVARIRGRSRDISARKHAELATREHDERLKFALETAAMASWSLEAGSDEPVWHDPPDHILGASPSGRHASPQDALHPEDLVRFIQALQRASRSGESWRDQYRVQRTDGSTLWVSIVGQPQRGPDGAVKRVIGVMQDISEIRRAEQALRDNERQLRLITDSVPASITYIDADQRVRFCNRSLPARLGLPMERILGQSLRELFGEEGYREVHPYVLRALAGETVSFDRVQRQPHGGARDISATYVPSHNERGVVDGFYSLVTDITELKRLDRMKSEFVSTVSHELRTPLTSIRGSLGLLAGGVAGALPDKARGLVDIAKNNCERLVRLINDILDIEKIESGAIVFTRRQLDLVEVVEQALRQNEGYATQHQVRLQLLERPGEAKVMGDQDRLIQVLTNLLSNACKFSPVQGTVDVAITQDAGGFKVAVSDHGPGISEEFRARIFQRFSQADSSDARQKGGTGLGLSISKAIVERLGGSIGFESEAGKGTTFFFVLPERTEPAAAARETEHAPAGSRPRILVVEDDADVGKLLQMLLDRAGFDSTLAGSAAEAKELASGTGFAAMTVDLALPDEDGLALVKALRSQSATRELPIVVVSATAEQGRLKLGAEKLGVVDWLSKPIDELRLVANLRHSTTHGGKVRLLHVEDDADVRRIVATLAADFAQCVAAETLAQARATLEKDSYDVVLLDIGLPDGSGWELMPLISRLQPRPRVVIFSAQNANEEHASQVQAFLVKSLVSENQLVETLRSLALQEA